MTTATQSESGPVQDDSEDAHYRLSIAVARAPGGALVLSGAGCILAANRQANDIFGYAPDEMVGRAVEDLVPELSHERLAHRSSAASQTLKHDPDRVFTGVRKDGVSIPLQVGRSNALAGRSQFVLLSIADGSELLNLKQSLTAATDGHLAFQGLVADIALKLARTASAGLDDLITNSLRQLAEALQLDRAILWQKNGVEPVATATHYWTNGSYPPPPMSAESLPFVISKLQAGEAVWFSRVAELPDPIDRRSMLKHGLRSGAAVPVSMLGDPPGAVWALTFGSMSTEYEWVPAVMDRLRLVAGVLSQALSRRASEASLATAVGELQQLRGRLAESPAEIRRDARPTKTLRLIVSESASVRQSLAQAEKVAPTSATVLLRGETGTGKEVFAQAIHDLSPRHQRPMVIVSCAAIPAALIESELFGRERGAYTGALSRQIGRFEAANQSTVFLDEIGELPIEMQVKLLRVLQERTVERLGSTQPIKVDVRIIAATNRDLEAAIQDGTFREDLFYRLDVFPIEVPPLRERVEDIPGLLWSFVDEFSRAFGKTIDSVPKANLRELQGYGWPGNVRELRNAVERAVILSTGRQLVVPVPRHEARMPPKTAPPHAMTLEALEIEHIRAVLESTGWRVRGPGGAADRLGLKPTTLDSRMARLGISRSGGGRRPSGHDIS